MEKLKRWFMDSGNSKKIILRNLLDRYVGQFLLEKLSVTQLSVDIISGRGSIQNLNLDVNALNEIAGQLNLPLKFVDGFIGEISVKIPWHSLFTGNCNVDITGLSLTLHPNHRQEDVSSVDSMMDSMSTSMQIAQKCFSQVDIAEDLELNEYYTNSTLTNSVSTDSQANTGLEGLELFAEAIDTILKRVQVRFNKTTVRLQYESDIVSEVNTGIAIDLRIDLIDYFDEAGMDKDTRKQEQNEKKADEVTAKKFIIQGISIFTDEFSNDISNCNIQFDEYEKSFHSAAFDKDINTSIDLSNRKGGSADNKKNKLSSEPVLITKIYGSQEVKLKIREVHEIIGPKVQLEAKFGSLIGFFTPRQIHLLMEFIEGYSLEEIESAKTSLIGRNQKPMNQNDYNNIENQLQKNLKQELILDNYSNQVLTARETWSVPAMDDRDDNFHPMDTGFGVPFSKNDPMTSSQKSDYSEFGGSVVTNASTQVGGKMPFNGMGLCDNRSADINLSIKMSFNSIGILLLHENLLVSSDDASECVTNSSLADMLIKSKQFFDCFENGGHFNSHKEEFENLEVKFDSSCLLSHMRLIISPFSCEILDKTIGRKCEHTSQIMLGYTEIVENIYDSISCKQTSCKILSFDETNQFNTASFNDPNISITVKETSVISKAGILKSTNIPITDISLALNSCHAEIDCSIIDRLNTLLNKETILKRDKTDQYRPTITEHCSQNNRTNFEKIFEEESKIDRKLNIQIKIPLMSTKIFFPIPDLRPLSDIQRVSWWERNVRKETMILKFKDVIFNASIDSHLASDNFEVKCSDVHVLYQQNEDCSPISLVRATMPNGTEKGFDLIRIELQVYPLHSENDLEDVVNNDNLMNKSMMGFLEDFTKNDPCIFTKRKIVSHQKEDMNDITLPASKEEINRFIDNTLENVQYRLDITLPQVEFILPSKHILEVLYNRLISDLLLWIPSAPKKNLSDLFDAESMKQDLTFQQFKFSKNFRNTNYTEEEMVTLQSTISGSEADNESLSPQQTYCTVMINIGNLIGYINLPCRDSSDKIIQNKQGELIVSASDCTIFVASGFEGKMDTCINSITASRFSLSHNACVKKDVNPMYLKSCGSQSFKHCRTLLYPSSPFMKMEGPADLVQNLDCLVLSIKTEFDCIKNEKKFLLAGGLNNITLNHIVTKPNESWIAQLQDMFSLEDYPIDGYCLPSVITELNFQLKYCSISYQPLNLPLKGLLLSDSVFISSNMNLEGDCSVLMIIIEDAGLFLSQQLKAATIKLKENYTCVAHLGLLEICAKLNGIKSELSLSNDMLHVRTCSDSFKSLLELLIYIANEGDLVEEAEEKVRKHSVANKKVIIHPSDSKEASYSPRLNSLQDLSDHSLVEVMMQEAMMDTSLNKSDEKGTNIHETKDIVSEFYFPDENDKVKLKPCYTEEDSNVMVESYVDDTISALEEALQDCVTYSKNTISVTKVDEEYCMLHNVPGSGIKSTSGVPQAQCFWTLNNFNLLPIKSSYYTVDETSASNCFKNEKKSMATTKNIIKDVSVTWYMYGGNDFKPIKYDKLNRPNYKDNIKSGSATVKNVKLNTVSFADGQACIITDGKSIPHSSTVNKNVNTKWYTHGGHDRDHDILLELQVSKIKFMHESYSEKSKILSQNILNICDFEIRDRLVSSQINKFLYQYYTEANPRQAKSNMITILATTVKIDPQGHSPETALSVSLRPIRLNIDQDSLIFLGKFFSEILSADLESEKGKEEMLSAHVHAPVMSINVGKSSLSMMSDLSVDPTIPPDSSQPTYFKSFVFSPDVSIKIDYHGKHIDINSEYGPLIGLIIGLGQLNNSEISLKRIEFLNGILGMNKLIGSVSEEWINDIKRNQLPSILGGVGPLHSFVQLANGIKDLIWLPIEQYQKDGRLLRGIQRGTSSFTSSSAYAALDLSGKFVSCIQSAAETMYDMVSPGPSVRHKSYRRKNAQPQDIREGVSSAFGLMRHGLGDTANTIWNVAAEEHFHKGMSGAVGGVLRQIPPSIVQPIILASEATCTVIGGLKNQLVPDARKEATEKWKV